MAKFAFDRSMRTLDQDGRLHVAPGNPISKATVSPYYGHEIPDYDELGLDPDKVYNLLRDPKELAKAIDSFNNLPVLNKHIPVSSDAPAQDYVVGSTGTDASFDDPYLTNSLVVWVQDSIDLIESDEQKELSAAYRYEADMSPGTFKGLRYDGIMRNIVGNHVALVRKGRAGPDVVIGDSNNVRIEHMLKSKKALLVAGVLSGFLIPRLAQDHAVNFDPILGDVTAKNFQAKKSEIVARVAKATNGRLAQDADLDGLVNLLDKLDSVTTDTDDDSPDDNDDLKPAVDAGDPMSRVLAYLKGKISDDELAEVANMASQGQAADADDDGEGNDDNSDDKKPAMDAALIERRIHARLQAVTRARQAVEPFVGALDATLNDPAKIYKIALDNAGVDLTNIPASAYEHMVSMLAKTRAVNSTTIAQDGVLDNEIKTRFPHVDRLGIA